MTSHPPIDPLLPDTSSRYDNLAILELTGQQKSNAAQTIITELNDIGIAYWSMMALSVVIATFGLMIDATAVVIGAMLIAPILSPLEGIAFATTTGNKKLFIQSFGLLLLSIGLGILIAVAMTFFIPPFQITGEILSRTQPTLIDLGIALASGVIAFLSFGYERIKGSLAGVAMAAALVPPLGVIGIGIGLLDWSIAWGSFVLFVTNLIAIILTGVIIFYLFGFFPTQKDDQKRSVLNMMGALGILALLCIPLASTLGSIKRTILQESTINTTILKYLASQDPDTTLEGFIYEGGHIDIQLQSPADEILTITQQNELSEIIAKQLNTDITTSVSITPRYTARPLDALRPSLAQRTRTTLIEFLEQLYPGVELIDLEIGEGQSTLLVQLYTTQNYDTVRIREKIKILYTDQGFEYDTILIQRLDTPTRSTITDQRTRTIQGIYDEVFGLETVLQSLQVFQADDTAQIEITLRLLTNRSSDDIIQLLREYQERLESVFQITVIVLPNIQYYETTTL